MHYSFTGRKNKRWRFNSFDFSLKSFNDNNDELSSLTQAFKEGFNKSARFEITAFVKLAKGQQVYPSQLLILKKSEEKTKHLLSINDIASISDQKIGNAIRTIDNWHNKGTDIISIETYGSVTHQNRCLRPPTSKIDFFSTFDDWVLKDIEISIEQQHYIIANLIRGGILGDV